MPGAQMQGRRGNVDGNGAIALRRKEKRTRGVRRLLLLVPSERQLGSVEDARICRRGGVFTPVRLVEEEPLRGATWQYSLRSRRCSGVVPERRSY